MVMVSSMSSSSPAAASCFRPPTPPSSSGLSRARRPSRRSPCSNIKLTSARSAACGLTRRDGMNRRENRGYSLIEVLVAIAITSVVLLTVVTLFYVGKRNVYGGKQRTYALPLPNPGLEDLSAMTYPNIPPNLHLNHHN